MEIVGRVGQASFSNISTISRQSFNMAGSGEDRGIPIGTPHPPACEEPSPKKKHKKRKVVIIRGASAGGYVWRRLRLAVGGWDYKVYCSWFGGLGS